MKVEELKPCPVVIIDKLVDFHAQQWPWGVRFTIKISDKETRSFNIILKELTNDNQNQD